jgi:hypothetical protein
VGLARSALGRAEAFEAMVAAIKQRELQLYLGRKSTGIAVRPDPRWPGMWRVHRNDWVSDMVNLTRAKDAARAMAHAGGTEVLNWRYRQRATEAPPVRQFMEAAE